MSPREITIENLARKIRQVYRREQAAEVRWERVRLAAHRWFLMLYWKFLKDDVGVRAESLSFLMIFSFLPLFAGVFFIFTVFTQFGMVQEAIGGFFDNLLSTLPADQRVTLQDFALTFKDNYLNNMMKKSGSLGIFALFFLIWIGLQTYSNIDRTLNFIWSSERSRPALEKFRNLIVVAIVAPIVLIASLSVPLILMRVPQTRYLFETVPLLRSLVNIVTPLVLIFGTLTVLYRYGPVRKVPWPASIGGGIFAAVALIGANAIVAFYFRMGTNSIYGKAAIVPVLCFWIYVVWTVIILGAEVSYLIHNKKYLTQSGEQSPTVFEAECLLAIVLYSYEAHRRGKTPVSFDEFFELTYLDGASLRRVVHYLERKHILVQTVPDPKARDCEYVLAQDIGDLSVGEVLKEYMLDTLPRVRNSAISENFHSGLRAWVESFEKKTISSYDASKRNGVALPLAEIEREATKREQPPKTPVKQGQGPGSGL